MSRQGMMRLVNINYCRVDIAYCKLNGIPKNFEHLAWSGLIIHYSLLIIHLGKFLQRNPVLINGFANNRPLASRVSQILQVFRGTDSPASYEKQFRKF